MNSTHEKLFVRRNIKTTDKFDRDVEPKYNRSIKTVAGITGKSSKDNLLVKDNAESFHQELKPLLIMMRLLGCFPVYFSKSG